jgi:hypothetical protein
LGVASQKPGPLGQDFYFRIGNKINTLLNFLGIEAKQFVIKMGQCNIMPVAKISDSK